VSARGRADKRGMGAQVYTELDRDPLPLPLLKKYIAYARAHVHPVLSDEAKQARASPLVCSAVLSVSAL
jgi:DNA replicative helicase MCM subunit Mcm2 (Cdc46/Mcm family)